MDLEFHRNVPEENVGEVGLAHSVPNAGNTWNFVDRCTGLFEMADPPTRVDRPSENLVVSFELAGARRRKVVRLLFHVPCCSSQQECFFHLDMMMAALVESH